MGVVFCGGQGGDQGNRALITNLYGEAVFTNDTFDGYSVNTPENVKALETLRDQDGINFDPAIAGGDEAQLFAQGVLAMATCWNVAMENNHAETMTFDAFPMAFPSVDGTPILTGGIWGFGIFDNGSAEKIEAAKTFVKAVTGDDALYSKAVEATNYWATREVPGLYEGNELMTEYGILVPMMGPYYQITKGWTQARTEWWNMLQRINTGADVKTELDAFVEFANAAAAAEG